MAVAGLVCCPEIYEACFAKRCEDPQGTWRFAAHWRLEEQTIHRISSETSIIYTVGF